MLVRRRQYSDFYVSVPRTTHTSHTSPPAVSGAPAEIGRSRHRNRLRHGVRSLAPARARRPRGQRRRRGHRAGDARNRAPRDRESRLQERLGFRSGRSAAAVSRPLVRQGLLRVRVEHHSRRRPCPCRGPARTRAPRAARGARAQQERELRPAAAAAADRTIHENLRGRPIASNARCAPTRVSGDRSAPLSRGRCAERLVLSPTDTTTDLPATSYRSEVSSPALASSNRSSRLSALVSTACRHSLV